MYPRFIKPLADRLVALVALLVLSPVWAVVALLLWVSLRGTPFFVQTRPGKNGKLFRLVKFRTMTNDRDASGKLLPDAERLTRMGRFVRRTSLDELPQLWNVVVGDMSLVGPRPLLVQYLERYDAVQARRHEVRPGITGWAQVNGRNALSWTEKFAHDVYYVDHQSFRLDMTILWMTVGKVFRAEGISQAGQATMEEFRGTNERING